jgi:hypothetical protein
VLIHVITEKGRGYLPAETASDKMHGVVKFDPRTGKQFKSAPAKAGSYTNYFADSLTAEAQRDSRIVAVHAAMAGGTGALSLRGASRSDRGGAGLPAGRLVPRCSSGHRGSGALPLRLQQAAANPSTLAAACTRPPAAASPPAPSLSHLPPMTLRPVPL